MAFLSQAFFDESGGVDTSHFVIGGYVGHVEMWKHFSDDWQDILDGKRDNLPAWPPFHAVEAESGHGGFAVLDYPQRLKRIGLLVGVIAKHKPVCVICLVDAQRFMGEVEAVLNHHNVTAGRKAHWAHPYEFGAAHLFGMMYDLQEAVTKRRGVDLGSIEVVFDHMDTIGARVREKIRESVIEDLRTRMDPRKHALIGAPRWTSQGERSKYTQLQAADLLVWHYGRSYNSEDGKHRRAFRDLKKAYKPHFGAPDPAFPNFDPQAYWIHAHVAARIQQHREAEARKAAERKKRGLG